jgi:hypothetical protein
MEREAFDAWWDTRPRLNETNPAMPDSFEYWAWEGWHAALAQPAQEPIHQWREKHSPYWYDGYPDNEDGGGPYETRTLYTAAKEKNNG